MERWSLQQFRLFEAVARHRSYTRAAEELHLTQPAVHIQIRRLEEAVGLKLFETVGRRLVLTRAGELTLAAANDVLTRLKGLTATVADLKGKVAGPLKVAVVTSAKYFVPTMLGEFLRRYPEVQPQLTVTNRARILERLAERRDDFVVMGQVPEDMDLRCHAFMENLLVPIAHPDHPLVSSRQVAIEALAAERFLMREPGSGTRSAIERLMAEHRLTVSTVMELGSTEAIKRAVMAGLGVSVLSLSSLDLELESGRVALLKVDGFPLRRLWFAAHHGATRLGPTADAFLSLLIHEGARQRRHYAG